MMVMVKDAAVTSNSCTMSKQAYRLKAAAALQRMTAAYNHNRKQMPVFRLT